MAQRRNVPLLRDGRNGTTHHIWGAMAVSPAGGGVAWQCLQERDGDGDLVAQYTYAPGYIDSPAIQQRDLNDDGDLTDTNEKVWYHSNTLHSVYALTDNAESVVERYRYDAYGAATVLDADGSDDSDGVSDVENSYAFTARRLDLESDLMYYRNRQYSVTLGRFISRDPEGYAASVHLYEYADSAPIIAVDPTGKLPRAGSGDSRSWLPKPARWIPGFRCCVEECRASGGETHGDCAKECLCKHLPAFVGWEPECVEGTVPPRVFCRRAQVAWYFRWLRHCHLTTRPEHALAHIIHDERKRSSAFHNYLSGARLRHDRPRCATLPKTVCHLQKARFRVVTL